MHVKTKRSCLDWALPTLATNAHVQPIATPQSNVAIGAGLHSALASGIPRSGGALRATPAALTARSYHQAENGSEEMEDGLRKMMAHCTTVVCSQALALGLKRASGAQSVPPNAQALSEAIRDFDQQSYEYRRAKALCQVAPGLADHPQAKQMLEIMSSTLPLSMRAMKETVLPEIKRLARSDSVKAEVLRNRLEESMARLSAACALP
ncbi:hypothetical protein [Rugamonas aquatica]|uniref:Uncharacterized protein n=1 Tax=Rugamonas aquatica TaxID=2743357 RepID=A0A6A7N6V5_9BURK|nr:hypothetical protein [Rugamonas aquatica]MQA40776.1 hypothetical protein [Rugamonas aquatica]